MKSCDEMVDSLLERREKYVLERTRKRKRTARILSVCCMCLAVGLCAVVLIVKDSLRSVSGNNELPIVSFYADIDMYPQYPLPSAGEIRMTYRLECAVKEYGSGALYRIYIDILDGDKVLPVDSEIVKAELERLSENGYDVSVENYTIMDAEYSGVVALVALEQLESFDANDSYGYYIHLHDECIPPNLLPDPIV